jgi:sugar lactone lactonase YvrE
MATITGPTTLVTGLHLPECPRWHDGELWFSDMWDRKVHRLHADGTDEVVLELDDDPGGLGWLPDGDLLVVGMEHRKLWRWDGSDLALHADLAPWSDWECNDMTVAADGTAYVTQFGFDVVHGTGERSGTVVVAVAPDGSVRAVADDLWCPNGIALDAAGSRIFVAEPAAMRVTSFAVAPDGSLSDRRQAATLPPGEGAPYAPPDGICLDAEGAVWAADPIGHQVVRVAADGTVTDVIAHDLSALAVTLGGEDGRTLFVCAAGEHAKARRSGRATGRVDAYTVAVAGSGQRP